MAEKLACVDTDICVDFLRKKEPGYSLFTQFIERYEPCVTAITAFELFLGQMKMKRKTRIDSFLEQFVLLPFDYKASKIAAEIQSLLDIKGKGIGVPDTLIAGICLANNVSLLTLNTKHFSRVPGLELIMFD